MKFTHLVVTMCGKTGTLYICIAKDIFLTHFLLEYTIDSRTVTVSQCHCVVVVININSVNDFNILIKYKSSQFYQKIITEHHFELTRVNSDLFY